MCNKLAQPCSLVGLVVGAILLFLSCAFSLGIGLVFWGFPYGEWYAWMWVIFAFIAAIGCALTSITAEYYWNKQEQRKKKDEIGTKAVYNVDMKAAA